MQQYNNFLLDNTQENWAALYTALLPLATRVAISQYRKSGFSYIEPDKIKELSHDMATEFIIEQTMHPARVVHNIPVWMHFLFKKIVYSRSNVKHDRMVSYDIQFHESQTEPFEIVEDEASYRIDEIKEHHLHRYILYYLSKPYSIKRTCDLLMKLGVTKKYIRDNAALLLRTKKVLNYA